MVSIDGHAGPPAERESTPGVDRETVQVDNVTLDLTAMLLWVDGRHVHVTVQEFILLRVLMENAGRILGREALLNLAWGPDQGRLSNTLQVFMSRLRRKLARPDGTSRIRTVRSVGYVFDVSALG